MNDIRALEEETKAELDRVSFHKFDKLLTAVRFCSLFLYLVESLKNCNTSSAILHDKNCYTISAIIHDKQN